MNRKTQPSHLHSLGADPETFWSSIVADSDDAIITKDLDSVITSWNRGAERLFGFTAEEALGQRIYLVIPPELFHEEEAIIQRLKRGERIDHVETTRLRKDGTRFPVSLTISPIRDRAGQIIGASKIARDITERKSAEANLRHQVEHLQSKMTEAGITSLSQTADLLREQARLLDLSFDAILVRDAANRITFWNRGAQELYGWAAQEALGKVSHALLETEFPEPFENIQTTLLQTGRWQGELLHTCRDGARIRVVSRWVQDWDSQGHPHRVLETNNDISARRRMELELHAAREQLARRAADLEQVVHQRTADLRASIAELESVSYSLSHDMRAPLRTIQSFCRIVLDEAGTRLAPPEQELLRKSVQAAARLDRLIRDVLIYSRVSRDAIQLVDVDLEQLLRQIIDERPEFQPPAALIQIDGPLAHVRAHEAYLTQCITNILENAVKFVAPGRQPCVRIWHEILGSDVRVWFADNGIGIPREAQERVFAIFERLHAQQTFPGTGIGLAIVKRAAERMGGAAGVQSEPGQGSRFWLRLARGE